MQDAAVIAGQVVLRRLTCPILEGAWALPCCSLNCLSSYIIRRSLWSAQSYLRDKGKCFLATRESQGRFFSRAKSHLRVLDRTRARPGRVDAQQVCVWGW